MTFWSRKRKGAEHDLVVRAGSTVKRDVYKATTAGVTGVTAFGALAVTGAIAGTAAHTQALKEQDQAAPPATPTSVVVEKRRKHRTVVQTRVVHEASTAVARPATGGTVHYSSSSSSGSSGSHSSGGSGGATHSAPKPAPAPSSGS